MGNSFDIRLEALVNPLASVAEAPAAAMHEAVSTRGTFFLETFGCQMNEHDSEKVAGLLMSRGYQHVQHPRKSGAEGFFAFG